MGGPQRVQRKTLRRLHGKQRFPIRRSGHPTALHHLDGIHDRQAGHAGGTALLTQAVQNPVHQSGGKKGAGRIVDKDGPASCGKRGQAETNGILPPLSARNSLPAYAQRPRLCQGFHAGALPLKAVFGKNENYPVDAGTARKNQSGTPVKRRTFPFKKLFGHPAGGRGKAAALPRGEYKSPRHGDLSGKR